MNFKQLFPQLLVFIGLSFSAITAVSHEENGLVIRRNWDAYGRYRLNTRKTPNNMHTFDRADIIGETISSSFLTPQDKISILRTILSDGRTLMMNQRRYIAGVIQILEDGI